LTGLVKQDNDKVEESVSRAVISIWQGVGRKEEKNFVGRLLAPALKPFRV